MFESMLAMMSESAKASAMRSFILSIKTFLCANDADDPDLFSLIDCVAEKPNVATKINPTMGGNFTPQNGEKMFLLTLDKGDEEVLILVTRRPTPKIPVDTGKSP